MDDLLTVKEMASKLRLSSQTLYKMVRHGEIPGVKVGNQWRFDPVQVHTWLTDKNTPTSGNGNGAATAVKTGS